jgi:hypothetical protein
MLGNDRASRMGARLLLGLALGLSCPTSGCDGGGNDKPAAFDPEVAKKNQELMNGGYRNAILKHRAESQAKAKAAATKGR